MTGDSLDAASAPAISAERRNWEMFGDWSESESEVECPEGVTE